MNCYEIPKYLLVLEDLKEKIFSGVYKPGSFLPSEKELENHYKVSRSTIRVAVKKLREAGMVIVVPGKGTKVIHPNISQELENTLSFTQVIESQGFRPGTRILSIAKVPAHLGVAQRLGIPVGSEVTKVERIRTADAEVVSYQLSFLNPPYDIDAVELTKVRSLYKYLENKYRLEIAFVKDEIYAIPTTEELSKLLEINIPVPLLVFDRIAYTKEGEIIEFSHSLVRSDRIKYSIKSYKKGRL
ncbi:MAG: GntR family transcriptional regulator [Thermotogae bacterium]|nr:GntR family transcriptional regulator [Thermotogota bacterium]